MTYVMIKDFFLWNSIINFGLLLISTLLIKFAHKLICRVHGKWFNLPEEKINLTFYRVLVYYKISIIMFNIVPLIALIIIGKCS